MRHFLLVILLMYISVLLYSQPDTWENITANGFNDSAQNTMPEVAVFKSFLYVASAPLGPGTAKLHRSATGNSGDWQEVTPPLQGDKSIHAFGTTMLDSGYIWCGTGSGNCCAIFRSTNGETWLRISERGFGVPGLVGATPHMVLFQGPSDTIPHLYAGGISHGGITPAQVWRIPYTSTDTSAWELVLDFAAIDSSVSIVSYFYVWNNVLYFGTDGSGQLWESSDGVNFTQNMYVGNGFGLPGNFVLSSFEVFNDTMYVTTTNRKGGQLWRSGDMMNWEQVTNNAFGEGSKVSELRSLRVAFNKLWVTAYTEPDSGSTGTPIWRSDDGATFIQSNTNGFGNSDNNGQNAVCIGFGNFEYLAGPNYVSGGQLWRTQMSTGINADLSNSSVNIFPNPVQDYLQISSKNIGVSEVQIYNFSGQMVFSSEYNSEKNLVIQCPETAQGIVFIKVLLDNNDVVYSKVLILNK